MKLEAMSDIQVGGDDDDAGVFLTDQQTETPPIAVECGERGTIALRNLARRLNPGTKICADRAPTEKNKLGPSVDHTLGEISFVVWRSSSRESMLGGFFLHDLVPEVDTPRALVVRAQILPMFETKLTEPLFDARITGRICRCLQNREVFFESGRSFQVIEWTWPTHSAYRVNRPGLPAQAESAETLRIIAGTGAQERHASSLRNDGSPRRIRHARAELVKAQRRLR